MQGLRREAAYGAELTGLCALVVAQPVLAVFGAAPEELTVRRASPLSIVVFALAVALLPPLILWLAEQPTRLFGRDWRDRIHRMVLGVLVGVLAIEVVKEVFSAPGKVLLVVGVAAGAGFFVVAGRREQLRQAARYLAFAPLAFVALFLFGSPVSSLVVGRGVGASDGAVAEPAPVLMLVLDELPTASLLDARGELDRERLPGFATLADDATWFRNTTTVAPVTPSAVPAILTGELPTELRPAPAAARFPDNLFTLLANSNELRVEESFTQLCPTELCDAGPAPSTRSTVSSLLTTAREVLGSVASPRAERADLSLEVPTEPTDPDSPDRFASLAERVGEPTASGRPPLDFLHVLLPHQPFDFTPDGLRYEAPDPPRGVEFGTWFDDGTAAVGQQRHLWQLQLADQLLADTMDSLRAAGTYDETLIVVVADHGISFQGEEPIRGVSAGNSHEIMWTPFFIKPPGQTAGSIDDGRVETIDILPTIADVLGFDLPDDVDGVSRLGGGGPADMAARMLDWRFSTLEPDDGDFVTVDGPTGFAAVLDAGPPAATADDPLRGQRIGPHGGLIGALVDDLDVGRPRPVDITLDIPQAGFDVTEQALVVPAYLSARYEGEPFGWVAVALDGEIVAVAQTYESGFGTSDLAATLPPERLTAGRHAVDLFAIDGDGPDPSLHAVASF